MLGWSLLIGDEDDAIWERGRLVPGLRWCAVGLVDPDIDVGLWDQELGVILYAEPAPGREYVEGLEPIMVADRPFPVRVRRGEWQEHAPPQPMPGGRLACWAHARGGTISGWLTARHVAVNPANRGSAVLLDQAPECLDAAIVDVGQVGPVGRRNAIAPVVGAGVHLDTVSATTATVLDVATNLGVQRSSRFPLRFSVNAAGVPGDSGSYISSSGNDPVGVYLGAFKPAGGAAGAGVGLAITQLEHFMSMEVHA